MLMRGSIVLHNNAHPPHGQNPSLCDFHVVNPFKKVLKGIRVGSDEDVKAMMVPAEAVHIIIYKGNPLFGKSIGCLP
jgi:hypothetical protein